MRHIAGWAIRLLLLVVLVPVALVTVGACRCACAAGAGTLRAEDPDIGKLLKQSEKDKKRAQPVGDKKVGVTDKQGGSGKSGGNNGGGNSKGNCGCRNGSSGNKNPQYDPNMFGAKGATVPSKSMIPRRRLSKEYDFRLDVENKKPGYIKGDIHVQLGGKGSTQYHWRGGTSFTSDKFEALPKVARQYIENNKGYVEKKIDQALRLLGEK